jgi:hypothetical protein
LPNTNPGALPRDARAPRRELRLRVQPERHPAEALEEAVHHAHVDRVLGVADGVVARRAVGAAHHDAVHHPVARLVAEPHPHARHACGAARHAEPLGHAVPECLHAHAAPEAVLGAPHLRDGLEADEAERVGVPGQPAHHVGHAVQVVARDGHGGRGAQRPPRGLLRAAHHGRELLAQRVEVGLGARGAPALALAAALRGVDVDADLGEPALHHELLEQPRAPAERVAVRHEHRDEVERARVAQQLHHLLRRAQRDLAVGELQVAGVAEHRAQQPHLRLDGLHRLGGHLVRLRAQVAAAAREVAARHGADGGAAAVALAAEHLLRHAHLGREPAQLAASRRRASSPTGRRATARRRPAVSRTVISPAC